MNNTKIILVEGMMCQHNCGATVQKALVMVIGVEKAEVSFVEKMATVWGTASMADLIDAIEMVGFDATEQAIQVTTAELTPSAPRTSIAIPKTVKDNSLPCASFSILGETSVPNLKDLKRRLHSLSGVQHVEIIQLSKIVEVSFHDSVTSGIAIAQSAADPFNNGSCGLALLNISGLASPASNQQQCEVDLEVTGMSCTACVVKVERALRATPGVSHVAVNLATKRATITTIASRNPTELADVVNRLGFKTVVTEEALSTEALQKSQNHEVRQWITLLAISLSFMIPLFCIKIMTPHTPWLMSSEPGFGVATRSELIQAALATPVQIIVGYRFYVAAFKGLMAEHPSMGMDFLVATGTSVAFFYSWFSLINLLLVPVPA